MNIGIIGLRGSWSSESLSQHLKNKGAGGDILELDEIHSDLTELKTGVFSKYDGIIIKKMGGQYSPHLLDELDHLSYYESQGLRFFSSPKNLRNMMSRLGCTLRLRQNNIPMPPTFITENTQEAAAWIRSVGQAVFKPLYSTKARGMEILSTDDDLEQKLSVIQDSGQKIIYLQKVMNLSDRDYGLVFLENEFLGAYARVGDGSSWNTTTLSGGKYQKYDPPQEIIELAQKAQQPFGLTFTSVDVAITDEGPIVFEVSAFGGYRGLFESSGIDASDLLTDKVMAQLKS